VDNAERCAYTSATMTLGPAAPFSANKTLFFVLAERIVKETLIRWVHNRSTTEFCCCGTENEHYSNYFTDFRDYHQLCLRTEGIQIEKA
jgi:hypothetical protein